MNVGPQSPPISLINKDKDIKNLNSIKAAIPRQEIIKEMIPKLVQLQAWQKPLPFKSNLLSVL